MFNTSKSFEKITNKFDLKRREYDNMSRESMAQSWPKTHRKIKNWTLSRQFHSTHLDTINFIIVRNDDSRHDDDAFPTLR